jgi:hypothetical protein
MKTILFLLCVSAAYSQEIRITLTTAAGETSTRSIQGSAVNAVLEVLAQFRADQCDQRRPDGTCQTPRYVSDIDAIRGLLTQQILALGERYPSSATAPLRQQLAAIQSQLAAARAALQAAVQ